MIEKHENLWDYQDIPSHIIGISTNGFVKNSGQAVMGRGCALEATKRFPEIAGILGQSIKQRGNIPTYIWPDKSGDESIHGRIYILPVKHNWWEKADLNLIRGSTEFLQKEALKLIGTTFHVPRLGCGNGKQEWASIKEIMSILPDNVWVHSI